MINNSYLNSTNFIKYLYYFLPLSIGFGGFLPNVFIILISIIFLRLIFIKSVKVELFPNKFFVFLLIFWLISILSSIFSDTKLVSLQSSIFYIRFIIFSYAIKWLLDNKIVNHKIFFQILLGTISFILFFAILEYITGYNIIIDDFLRFFDTGPIEPNTRISGLFGDEQVLGGYLLRILLFLLIIYSIAEKELTKKIKFYFLIILIFCGIFIFLSGERSSIFLLILSILSIFMLINGYNKTKISISLILILTWTILILSKPHIHNRIVQQTFYLQLYSKENNKIQFFSKIHEAHFSTALNIFKDKPILGGGNKSFRTLCHYPKYSLNIPKFKTGKLDGVTMGCATHPHNFYIQILAENGIFNFIIIIFFYFIILKKLFIQFLNKFFFKREYLENKQIYTLLFFAVLLWPIVPSGSFFTSWIASTLFLPIAYLSKEFNK